MRRARRFGPLFAAGLLWCSAVHAQPPSANDVALAREQFKAGVEHASAGRWERARDAFARAYGVYPQPAILLNLASAEVRTGRLVAGAESYRRLLRAPGDLSPDQLAAARDALAAVEPRIARLRIRLERAQPSDRVELDGARVAEAAIDAELPVDPGDHQLRLVRAGTEVVAARVALAEGETRSVVLRAPPPTPRAAAAPRDQTESRSVFASPWFWGAVGVVVVGGTIAVVCAATCGREPHAGTLGTVKLP